MNIERLYIEEDAEKLKILSHILNKYFQFEVSYLPIAKISIKRKDFVHPIEKIVTESIL